ncbi:MAG TPA: sirohydrochlorin nickelochelatase [Methanothermobacter sp.]|jgi:sirohydrochlorin cobaltochelatase|uniref:Sirohydrochlorin cobaltochelatase n=1 Tax=Methanothermobacter tenebrarum TaxID=680118 RepID=A0ABM7YFE8_9EURY|nr:sirohydrochlorin nickelochelatase [Methanothermobacter tenebrarum]MDD3455263.1 sirohydrochlorin nickelochelatase [Methanobacteriales archaeon]MDX9693626.1 sirohydrochlorin nickelochelatase [Methanothermobacter sp.]BDH80207.1 sirohydrochlorin nickelochelatase [Methanothermobacter tenebrarum]HHW16003.1 sirohydrochlorin nickelochelatase [Methanothermobacter sp.]HOQ19674.1 sirohydrochlorin nickelochelatase [Methanothermobacter sp.]
MASNSNQQNKIGVLLVGHGSRLPYGEKVIKELARLYKMEVEYPVAVGFMNISKPTIPEAIKRLSQKGVKKIIVTPVFLAHGVHTKHDIPHILGIDDGKGDEHSHEHQHEKIDFDGEIIYTEPLGADPRIVEIIKDRVSSALP